MAAALRFVLPTYYKNTKLKEITKAVERIKEYKNLEKTEILDEFYALQERYGGFVYSFDEGGTQQGQGVQQQKGRGKGSLNRGQRYGEQGFLYGANNKQIHSFIIEVDNTKIFYDVPTEELTRASNIMLTLFLYMFPIGILIAIVIAYYLSSNISRPILELNDMALAMKSKEVQALITSKRKDEIGQLHNSIQLMYQELLSNIQQLESQLAKERSLDKLQKQFFAQATHELKTPLAVIQGYAELIYDNVYKNDEERDELIQKLYKETKGMNNLIKTLLEYSSLEHQKANIENVNIKQAIENAIPSYDVIVSKYGKELTVNNTLENISINIDMPKVERLIRNLLDNAGKHAKEQVKLKLTTLDNNLLISVYNDGNNIDEEDIPYIFDSFYKGKNKQKGTGLGLAIVKSIVNMHNGQYRLENKTDGVEFFILLPDNKK